MDLPRIHKLLAYKVSSQYMTFLGILIASFAAQWTKQKVGNIRRKLQSA